MRVNKYVAQATGLSRRAADRAVTEGRVTINNRVAVLGEEVENKLTVRLDNRLIELPNQYTTIMLNKPPGYVCSRVGQGSQTIYDLLPPQYQNLKIVGRLDKASSGLLLLTDNGDLANRLTHPRHTKIKLYQVSLNKPLELSHRHLINDEGIELDDGLSRFKLVQLDDSGFSWQIAMTEGRNRQIRRTFTALGYTVKRLHRVALGQYSLASPQKLSLGKFRLIPPRPR